MKRKSKVDQLMVISAFVLFSMLTCTTTATEHFEPKITSAVNERADIQRYSFISPAGSAAYIRTIEGNNQYTHSMMNKNQQDILGHQPTQRNMFTFDGSDWSNSGGNAERNGLSDTTGPKAADILWSGGRTSIISWLPMTEGNRLFVIRQTGWPGSQHDSPIVAMDLSTGEELWAKEIPYNTNDWTTWIAGVKNGQVYASRSGNGASVKSNLYALDAESGDTLWISTDLIDAGPYDGVVFAPDGDPVVASFTDIWRINAEDGITVWHTSRLGSVSGSCGGALYGDSFYVADVTGGGHIIVRYNLNTGQRLYQSPVMPGFTLQNTPMVGSDGTIYLSRTQNNPAVDYFYAFTDTGTSLSEKWHIACAWTTFSEYATGPEGSVYCIIPGPRVAKINPDDGTVIAQSELIADPSYTYLSPHFAIDAIGTVYFSNGGFSDGRVDVFTSDLDPVWNSTVHNINIGGPALCENGILLLCGIGTDIRAYHSLQPMIEINVTGGFGKIRSSIKNVGEVEVTNLSWSISAMGGLVGRINVTISGVIPVLAMGEEREVASAGIIFGFGKIDITIKADQTIKTVKGFALGPFIFIR